ncbi:MurR/RpiR family transcriptional regulator [Companilactobacillus sp. DQM5]|uniref:MurR/RpiR family transcriptional regulator n=1 Tax=Companilactobacillus sp. DQM5 TaxID=3463359 RepID=UPI0040598110
MENVLLTIKQKLTTLSEAEQKVGNYVIKHSSDILKMKANELAKRTGVSPATIVRFSKSITGSGFPELKILISSSLNIKNDIINEINPEDTVNELKEKMGARVTHTIQQTNKKVSNKNITKASKLIFNYNTVVAYGISASGLVAQDFTQKFLRIGKNVSTSYDTHVLSTIMSSNINDVILVLFSNSGETLECKNLLNFANKKGIKSIVISHSPQSYMAKNCTIFLEHDVGQEKETMRTAATTSLLAQLYITDLIYYDYFRYSYDDNIKKIKDSSQAIRNYFEGNK